MAPRGVASNSSAAPGPSTRRRRGQSSTESATPAPAPPRPHSRLRQASSSSNNQPALAAVPELFNDDDSASSSDSIPIQDPSNRSRRARQAIFNDDLDDDEPEQSSAPVQPPPPSPSPSIHSDTDIPALPIPAASDNSRRGSAPSLDVDLFFDRGSKKIAGSQTVCRECGYVLNRFKYSPATGTTVLQGHIERNHLVQYEQACREKGIPLQLGVHKGSGPAETPGQRDRTAFSLSGLHKHLVAFIVADDQSLNVIECPEFRQLLLFMREKLEDHDIPHRTHLRKLIIDTWLTYFAKLQADLAVCFFTLNQDHCFKSLYYRKQLALRTTLLISGPMPILNHTSQ
ncbi:hypothetical protein C8J56DRAFT_800748 [Mycena floridula]|nr:hypothetical protein C8J56DRAFT_800748 [Mycena floridula]